jgi:hypothetical protein
MPCVNEMHVVATVSFHAGDCRDVLRPVIGPTVEHLESGVLQFDNRSHHELKRLRRRPRAHVIRTHVHVHFRRVDLEHQLTYGVQQSRGYEVVQRRPLGEFHVHFHQVERSLKRKIKPVRYDKGHQLSTGHARLQALRS